ncbi:hypothetical protein PBAL39_10326 [Pedobacter sp. BAL39]|uniref:nuclear transport factor 2 family protein n=1 Tax=Pedobacter sp. BAL39 TaxID=391596 RepID=UPI00015594F0|nr:nuclear transport factor 2 family protein [Pedobacter sp. BAL39]EDM37533.1 hypothetical protein PBAL39_10326 [Pedobacter sp. BAL39]
MNPNEALLHAFYTCFKNADFIGMQSCYHDEAVFNDSIFSNLTADEVKAMWAMLVSGAKDMQVNFSDIRADDHSGSAHWEAVYTFSSTGNKVINKIDGSFIFKDGKILRHNDHFDFYTWATQAFGLTGILIGWTSFFKHKVKGQAQQRLKKYMSH